MQPISLNDLRESFLAFFEGKGHLRMPSFSLIPHNDKSLLLTNSGMAPLKPYFTGAERPPSRRVVTCQKCIRTPDIDNVGKTARHGTYFEMLGNFSFADYFKKESIAWGWEYMTSILEIPPELLYVSVYLDDDEAYDIWKNDVGVPEHKIVRLGKADNFWEHGLGPCGPCSEIYYDRGAAYGCEREDCAPGCDCDRYIEVWNHVFTQFDRKDDGSYETLTNKNIDTGMGLERLACVVQGVGSIFEVDTIKALLDAVCAKAGVAYNADYKTDVSVRLITDHVRSSAMMAADGVVPSNEGRGYVLRRLLRRAELHGRLLGIKGIFLSDLSSLVVELSGGAYPELAEKSGYIKKIFANEEERFGQTLDQGLAIFQEMLSGLRQAGGAAGGDLNTGGLISGAAAFKLHDTYGFPLDLTREMAAGEGFGVDEAGFAVLMGEQRAKARAALKLKDASAWGQNELEGVDKLPPTIFTGYTERETDSVIINIYGADGSPLDSAGEGDAVTLVLERTPFYAESGGQSGDTGGVTTAAGWVTVFGCNKTGNGVYLHSGEVGGGGVARGERAKAAVDGARRADTEKNHTATHLLQAALKRVLGDHVNQSGSMVGPERLRFDFNHFEQVNREKLDEVETAVNNYIFAGMPVTTREMGLDEARAAGAQALFGEKYGDAVRVVDAGDVSKELCGGTHVENTLNIGLFTLLSESGVAAGVRRIEALTGAAAFRHLRQAERTLVEAAAIIKSGPGELPHRLNGMLKEIREREREIDNLKDRIISGLVDEALDGAVTIKTETRNGMSGGAGADGIRLIVRRLDQLDADGLGKMADSLRERDHRIVAVIASGRNGRADFIAAAGKDAILAGADAGKIVKAVASAAGGGGGGRRDVARAGGKDPSLLAAALSIVPEIVKKQIGGGH